MSVEDSQERAHNSQTHVSRWSAGVPQLHCFTSQIRLNRDPWRRIGGATRVIRAPGGLPGLLSDSDKRDEAGIRLQTVCCRTHDFVVGWNNGMSVKMPLLYVRDNPRLGMRYRILMHDVEVKNHPTRSGGWLPLWSALKLCNAHWTVDYPAYVMVTCQH